MRIFKGENEIALSEDDVIQAIEEFFENRFKLYGDNVKISNLKHCRSDSTYCLRFNIEQLTKVQKNHNQD